MFTEQALLLQQPTRDGKRRRRHGNRLTFSFTQPNYMLMSYDNAVSDSPQEKPLAPTRTEVWAKALYSAALIHLLIGARVYITDRPYLTITRPEQMKTIIEMEGLPPLLYGLFAINRSTNTILDAATRPSESSARVPIATLPALLDLLAAVWEITVALFRSTGNEPRNLDKQVATILSEIRGNHLAGATLYKMRERDHLKPYDQFIRACQILLPQHGQSANEVRRQLQKEGYELLMDTNGKYSRELAEKLTDISLNLFLPLSAPSKGRAHRYERLFRTGIESLKNNTRLATPDLIGTVAGRLLKTVDRATGGARPSYGAARNELAHAFARLLVEDLYLAHCDRSTSKLTHMENSLADAIYFFTDQQISSRWQAWQERKKHDPRLAQEEVQIEHDMDIQES
jgi:CRISPR type I-D-associated protein Csc3/Cas10d